MRVCTRFTPEDNRRLEGRGLMMLMRGVQIKIMMHNTTVDLRLTERRCTHTHTHARAYKRTHQRTRARCKKKQKNSKKCFHGSLK